MTTTATNACALTYPYRIHTPVLALVVLCMLPVGSASEIPVQLAISLLGTAIGAIYEATRGRALLKTRIASVLVWAAFLAMFAEIWLLDIPMALGLSHFFMWVCAIKSCGDRTLRELGLLTVLSLLLLAVGSIVCATLLYPVVLAISLLLAPYVCLLLHVQRETMRAERRQVAGENPVCREDIPTRVPMSTLLRMAVLGGSGSFIIGIAAFIFLPRTGGGYFHAERAAVASLTGYAEQNRFGDISRVATSDRLVMRVELSPDPNQRDVATPPLLLRGGVFEAYDRQGTAWDRGWRWRVEEPEPGAALAYEVGKDWVSFQDDMDIFPNTSLLQQTIWLEPVDSPRLFVIYPALAIKVTEGAAIRKNWADHTLSRPQGNLHKVFGYSVISAMDVSPTLVDALRRMRESLSIRMESPAAALNAGLPAAARIRTLAEEWSRHVGPASNPDNHLQIAQAICDRLRSGEFQYTLDRSDVNPSREPTEDFLFYRRRGHCEYFASTLAVMCQLLDIPARLVQGFHIGEYNPIGRYYLVRQKDAHAWVEVYDRRRDWVTLDPTPAGATGTAYQRSWFSDLQKYVDVLQFRWAMGIVNYDTARRDEVYKKFQDWLQQQSAGERLLSSRWAPFLWDLTFGPSGLTAPERVLYWFVLALTLAFVFCILRIMHLAGGRVFVWLVKHLKLVSRPRRRGVERLYERFLRIAAHKGLVHRAHETPREFVGRLLVQHPQLRPATELVDALYAAEYGRVNPSTRFMDSMTVFLRDLEWGRIALVKTTSIEEGNACATCD